MRAFRFVEHVDRPPEQVWAVLVDVSVAPRWRPLIKFMETVDGGPVRANSAVRITIEFFGKLVTRVSQTVAFEPGRRWVLRSSDSPQMEGWFEFVVEREGAGTQVVATCDLKAHALLSWLSLPLIARGERRRRAEMLGNLKRFVESLPIPVAK